MYEVIWINDSGQLESCQFKNFDGAKVSYDWLMAMGYEGVEIRKL